MAHFENPQIMKRFFLLIPAFITVLFFKGCKKGEDDPALSLRTRKARLSGEWRLKEGTASYTALYNGAIYNYAFRFNGIKCEEYVTDYYGTPTIHTFAYLLNVKLEKDGTFYFKEIISGKTLEATGTWDFNHKTSDSKNKESFRLHISNIITGSLSDDHLFNQLSVDFIFKIKELRNKKIVLTATRKMPNGSNPDATYSCGYTLIQ